MFPSQACIKQQTLPFTVGSICIEHCEYYLWPEPKRPETTSHQHFTQNVPVKDLCSEQAYSFILNPRSTTSDVLGFPSNMTTDSRDDGIALWRTVAQSTLNPQMPEALSPTGHTHKHNPARQILLLHAAWCQPFSSNSLPLCSCSLMKRCLILHARMHWEMSPVVNRLSLTTCGDPARQ